MSENIYEGIISINVQDNDAAGRLSAIIEQLQMRFAELGRVGSAEVGAQTFTGLQEGAAATSQAILSLETQLRQLAEVQSQALATRSNVAGGTYDEAAIASTRSLITVTNEAIIKLNELRAVQARGGGAITAGGAGVWSQTEEMKQAYPQGWVSPAEKEAAARAQIAGQPVAGAAALTGTEAGMAALKAEAEATLNEAKAAVAQSNKHWSESYYRYGGGQNSPGLGSGEGPGGMGYQQLARGMTINLDEGTQIGGGAVAGAGGQVTRPYGGDPAAFEDVRSAAINNARALTASTTSVTELSAAQNNMLAAVERQKLVFAKYADETEISSKGLADMSASQAQVDSANVRLARAQDKAALQQTDLTIVEPSMSYKIQQAQTDSAIAESKLRILTQSDATFRTEIEINAARLKVLQANERLAATYEKEAAAGAEGGGGGGGMLGGMGGVTALKYYAFYQAFSLVQEEMSKAIKDTEAYTLSVNQLSISMGIGYSQANELAQSYAAVGQSLATAPAVAVNAATQLGRIFQDQTGAAQAVGAELGSQIALLEGAAKVPKVQADLGAFALNYQLAPQQAQNLYGSATYIAQQFGQQTGGALLGGGAQISDLTRMAGLTPEQTLSMLGAVSERSGSTSEATSAELKRLLGRAGSSSFQALFSEYQIHPGAGGLAQEFAQLSPKLSNLPPGSTAEAQAVSTLGGGRSGAAFLNMIQNFSQIMDVAAKGAEKPATAAEQAQKKLETFAGKIEKIGADAGNLAIDLGTSGLGKAFGGLILMTDQTIIAVDDLVKEFNKLPGVFQAGAAAAGLAALALARPGAITAATGFLNQVNPLINTAAKVEKPTETATNTAALTEAAVAIRAHTAALMAEVEAATAAATTEAEAAAATAAAATAAAGGAVAAGADATAQAALDLAEGSGALAAGTEATAQAALDLTEGGGALAAAGAALGGLAAAAGAAAAVVIPLGLAIWGIKSIFDQMAAEDLARRGQKVADTASGVAQAPGATQTQLATGVFAEEDAIKKLRAAGATTGGPLPGATVYGNRGYGTPVDPALGQANKQLAADIKLRDDLNARLAVVNAAQTKAEKGQAGGDFWGPGFGNIDSGFTALEGSHLPAKESAQQMMNLLVARGKDVSALTMILGNADMAKEVSGDLSKIGKEQNPDRQIADMQALRAVAQKAVDFAKASGDMSLAGGAQDVLDSVSKPLDDLVVKHLNEKIASIKAFEGTNASSRAKIEALLQSGMTQMSQAGDVTDLAAIFNVSSKAQVQGFVKAIEVEVKAAQAAYDAEKRTVDEAAKVIQAAYDVQYWLGNQTGIEGMFGNNKPVPGISVNPGAAPQTPAQKALAAQKVGLDALKAQLGTATAAEGIAAPSGSATGVGNDTAAAIAAARAAAQATPGDPISQARAAIQAAQAKLSADAPNTVAYWTDLKGLRDAQYSLAQAEQAGSAAQLSASAIPGDPLSQATVNVQVAQNAVANAVGSAAYWAAVKGLKDAQYAYAQAQLAAANDVDLLAIDMTNPVLMAQEKVREASRTLSLDKGRGAGTSVINKDMVALRQATSAAQKASFDQQFSDEQTNYQLHRISLQAYLSYLNAQHAYLTAVHVKTRQQVDELNQVDQALKGLADQMQGQFNLGAIKVPTVYEARAGTGLATNNIVTITINGTDIPAVKAVLSTYVGQAAMSTSGSAARKV